MRREPSRQRTRRVGAPVPLDGVAGSLRIVRACQVPQVDITELADFLMVAWAMYSLYSFLTNNDDRPTGL
jgi:hypothetical protein